MKCLLEEGRIPHFLLFMRNNTSLAIPLSKKKAKIEPNETVVNNAPPILQSSYNTNYDVQIEKACHMRTTGPSILNVNNT